MDFLHKWLIEPFDRSLEQVLLYMPNIFVSLFILILGVILGTALKYLLLIIFKAIKLDHTAIGISTSELVKKGGIKESFSVLLAKIIRGVVVIFFALISLFALNIPLMQSFTSRFLLYLPNLFAACLIVLLGYVFSNFFGRAALIAAVNSGFKMAGFVGKLVKLVILLLAITMALEQLGIGKDAILIAFAILFGGFVLSLALAFGFGGRFLAEKFLRGKLEEEEKDEFRHL